MFLKAGGSAGAMRARYRDERRRGSHARRVAVFSSRCRQAAVCRILLLHLDRAGIFSDAYRGKRRSTFHRLQAFYFSSPSPGVARKRRCCAQSY